MLVQFVVYSHSHLLPSAKPLLSSTWRAQKIDSELSSLNHIPALANQGLAEFCLYKCEPAACHTLNGKEHSLVLLLFDCK